MKKAFTLIELMIVIAVMAILMGLVFRLNAVGTDSSKRSITIMRLQKIENCLSGYYAAFGGYPPVRLHGTRDIFAETNEWGIQNGGMNDGNWGDEELAWSQVNAACRAQPIGCAFPYPDSDEYDEKIRSVAEAIKKRLADEDDEDAQEYLRKNPRRRALLEKGFDNATRNVGRFSGHERDIDWRDLQLFKFGLMSYLLPRYLVMMNGPKELFEDFDQWGHNNVMPCDPYNGRKFNNWNQVKIPSSESEKGTYNQSRILNIPSQAVCARWMPNLAGICSLNRDDDFSLFGINIKSDGNELTQKNLDITVYSPDENPGNNYILDGITVKDGWNNEFYYYSPSPYQRYTLWSAGPDRKTFPPWIDKTTLTSAVAKETAARWVVDDIIHLSN